MAAAMFELELAWGWLLYCEINCEIFLLDPLDPVALAPLPAWVVGFERERGVACTAVGPPP